MQEMQDHNSKASLEMLNVSVEIMLTSEKRDASTQRPQEMRHFKNITRETVKPDLTLRIFILTACYSTYFLGTSQLCFA